MLHKKVRNRVESSYLSLIGWLDFDPDFDLELKPSFGFT